MGEGEAKEEHQELREDVGKVSESYKQGEQHTLEELAEMVSRDYAYHLSKGNVNRDSGIYIETDYNGFNKARAVTEKARNDWGYSQDIYSQQFELMPEKVKNAPVIVTEEDISDYIDDMEGRDMEAQDRMFQ